jgi:hypothetical protein
MDSLPNQHLKPQRRAMALAPWFAALSCLALLTFAMPSHATEEPDFKVIRTLEKDIELRDYAPYVVAEVVVPGPADEAGNRAFPILAGYIFGKNKGERTFAMTAPVTQTAVPVKLEMTAPVTQTAVADGYLVQFVMPKEVNLATAPEPLDARITLRMVPNNRVAVIRYSGLWSESNYASHLAKLQEALSAAKLNTTGEAVYSRYNAPFTPWFMRRNEIWLRLTDVP